MLFDENIDLPQYIESLDLKKLSYKELDELCAEIRKYIIDKCSKNGGHLASNLGVVELTVAIHRMFNLPKDKVLFDVGHQCYTHKILSGRSLVNLRQEDGIDGFQRRNESEYDYFEAGHSSTALSSMMGIASSRDFNGEDYNVITVVGDSSISSGLAFEALNNFVKFNHKMILIVNDNHMSISNSTGAVAELFRKVRKSHFHRPFVFLGCDGIPNVDGHNIKKIEKALAKAIKSEKTVIIHVKTTKGKGYKYSEANTPSWHSVKPFDKETGEFINHKNENEESWANIFAKEVEKILEEDKKSIIINPSMTLPCGLNNAFKKYPERSFDVGICEEHAITFAAGYALSGNHAYVSMYSTFLQRAYDEINHDLAKTNVPVTMLIDHAGLVGSDGESHQGIFDESFLINMPNVAVTMPKDNVEAIDLMNFSKSYAHPLAIRYPVGNTKLVSRPSRIVELGKWEYETNSENKNVAVIAVGPKVNEILDTIKDITVVDALFLSPMDESVLKDLLSYQNVVIYDVYGIKEGFVLHVQNRLLELGYKGKIHIFALPNEFIRKGTVFEQEKRCGVDINTVTSYISKLK